jgi:predicted RNA-binding protein Jag
MSTIPTQNAPTPHAGLETFSASGGPAEELKHKLFQQAEGRELYYQEIEAEDGSLTVYGYPRTQVMDLIYDMAYPVVKLVDDRAILKVKSNRAVTDFFLIIQSRRSAGFIGKHGQTLDAIETLVGFLVSKRFPGKASINVDVDNSRPKRQSYLEGLIKKVVREIERDHHERAVHDLLPKERKFVHQYFSGHPYLTTESRGEGSQRTLWIKARSDIVEE